MTEKQWIDSLNGMVKADPKALFALCLNRVPTNKELGDHPTVQVDGSTPGSLMVGMVGILNGLFSSEHPGKVLAFTLDDERGLVGFQVVEPTYV